MKKIQLTANNLKKLLRLYENHLDSWESGDLDVRRCDILELTEAENLVWNKQFRYQTLHGIFNFISNMQKVKAISYVKVYLNETGFETEENRASTGILLDEVHNVIIHAAENICGHPFYNLGELCLPYNADGSKLKAGQIFEGIGFLLRKKDVSIPSVIYPRIKLEIDLEEYCIEEFGLPEILVLPQTEKGSVGINPWTFSNILVYANKKLYQWTINAVKNHINSCFTEFNFDLNCEFVEDGILVSGRCYDCKSAGYLKKADVILKAKFGMNLKLQTHEISYGKPTSIK